MKQHITPDQLAELTDKQKVKLVEWWNKNYSDKECREILSYVETCCGCSTGHYSKLMAWMEAPLLSISQMIEFIDENRSQYCYLIDRDANGFRVVSPAFPASSARKKNGCLCNTLWEAVKEILNKE